jgi:prepilin-type processing-associated H-X9-DG protein
MYVSDYDAYPHGEIANGIALNPSEQLQKYLSGSSNNVEWGLRCRQRREGLRADQRLPYAYNDFARTLREHNPYLGLGGDFLKRQPVRESQVVAPVEMVALTEVVVFGFLVGAENILPNGGFTLTTYAKSGQETGYPHYDSQLNELFCDGHVGSITKREIASGTDAVKRRWFNDNQPHHELLPIADFGGGIILGQ